MTHKNNCILDNSINGGFWKIIQDRFYNITLRAVYERFKETGRFDALKGNWRTGMPHKPHIFWDSDVAKWVEGAAYFLKIKADIEIENKIDEIVSDLKNLQAKDGYLNSYFQIVEPGERFKRRTDHELYCAGHWIEAALAYEEATGKKELLEIVLRYVDLIDEIFRVKKIAHFDTPGHEEIELALIKLYKRTNDSKHLELARFFINMRGNSGKDATYSFADQEHLQSHMPVREQHTAEGHAVRALYLYTGMELLSQIDNDDDLHQVCLDLFENIHNKRMSITGGIGSTYRGESFSYDYDLPLYTPYNETCASIALVFFCKSLWNNDQSNQYADIAELALYNTVLSGVSLSGDRFFYENPLAVNPERQKFNNSRPIGLKEHLPILERVRVFDCSCCPPNLLRIIGSISEYAYSVEGDTISTQCYMNSLAHIKIKNNTISLNQRTEYPWDGNIEIKIHDITNTKNPFFKLFLRIPAWCDNYEIKINNKKVEDFSLKNGYIELARNWQINDRIQLSLMMPVKFVRANPFANELAGHIAVMRGPVVYCSEGHDFKGDAPLYSLKLISDQELDLKKTLIYKNISGSNLPCLNLNIYAPTLENALYFSKSLEYTKDTIQLIPYFAWANRGISEMITWFLEA